MKKKLLVLCLLAAMLVTLFAGCGAEAETSDTSSDAAAEESTESVETETEETTAAEETPEEETAEEETAAEESPAEASEEAEAAEEEEAEPEAEAETASVTYPLEGDETLTAWVTLETPFREAIDDWNDLSILPNMKEATGVTLEFTTVSADVASEQFPLMLAGGDWTDLIPISYYSGGDSQAYEDDVIVDLTDLLPTYAPDYWATAQSMDTLSQDAMISGDKYLTFYTLLNAYYQIEGPCIRQDWLDELGLEVPTDLESFTEVMKAFYDNYQPDYTLYTSTGNLYYLSDLFGTDIVGYETNDNSLPIHVRDGQVVCSYTTDEYREYLEWFQEMYEYGVINDSFYSINEMDGTARNNYVADGQIGYWTARCESIDEWKTYTNDENVLATANPQPTSFLADEDGVFNWADEQSRLFSRVSWCITTACSSPETALQFLNYFFTEDGSILANYGVEGVTWERDSDGNPAYTDMVLNNPDGLTAQLSVNVYTASAILPCYSIEEKLFVSYTDNAQKAIDLYNEGTSADYIYPSAAALTTEETNSVSGTITEIMTSSAEQLMKFMTCAEDITDETWNAYLDSLEELGLSNVLAVYQNAYDEYVNGER